MNGLNVRKKLVGFLESETFESAELKKVFEKLGVSDVRGFLNEEEILKALEENVYDLFLIDIKSKNAEHESILKALDAQYPSLPVIVFTEDKSKETILKCIELGASDYIPKPLAAERLIYSISEQLDMGIEISEKINEEHTIHEYAEIRSLRDKLELYLSYLRYPSVDIESVSITLEELCKNAIVHGNKKDKTKKVFLHFDLSYKSIKIRIEDEGDGFDINTVSDPTNYKKLKMLIDAGKDDEYSSGRGIWMSKHFMDEVKYEGKGNIVNSVKSRTKA